MRAKKRFMVVSFGQGLPVRPRRALKNLIRSQLFGGSRKVSRPDRGRAGSSPAAEPSVEPAVRADWKAPRSGARRGRRR